MDELKEIDSEEYYNKLTELITSMFEWVNLPEGIYVCRCAEIPPTYHCLQCEIDLFKGRENICPYRSADNRGEDKDNE